jgi:hypothetical protein
MPVNRSCFWAVALLVVVFSACAQSQAKAEYQYFEDFNTQLNPSWWTLSSSGSVTASYITDISNSANKLILMRYTAGPEGYLPGEGNLQFNFPVQGDFSASITYNLYNWPVPDNAVTAGIRTELGDVNRHNNGAEFYLTDFLGDTAHSAGTDDTKGRLRIIRTGTTVQGAYYDPAISDTNKWLLIGQYNSASLDDIDIKISLWPGVNADKNVSVVFDDFNLHVYAENALDPRGVVPEPASMLLFGAGAAAMAVAKRRMKKTV